MHEYDSTFARTPEPEVMEEEEQCAAYANADFSEANESFISHWRSRFPDAQSGIWADLGCGPADIPIRLCTLFSEISIVAADASEAMIDLARRDVSRQNLEKRIRLFCGLVSNLTPPDSGFDGIISNSLLHHLPDPTSLWNELIRQGKAGSPVMVMDLRRPPTHAAAADIVERYSAEDPEVLRKDFYNSLLAAYTPSEIHAQLDTAGLKDLAVESISDRHLLVWGRLPG